MKLECSSQLLARQQSSSRIQSGFPALASALNETPKKIPYGGELCILCRKSFLVAKEKINVFGKSAFDISSLVKGQMQRNLDNFSFVENPFQKHQSYQQEAESALKICFCVLKIRKSDDFRELYENEPEMAAPRLETNIRYL